MTVAVRVAEEALRTPAPADRAPMLEDHQVPFDRMPVAVGVRAAAPVVASAYAPADASHRGAAAPARGTPGAEWRALAADALDAADALGAGPAGVLAVGEAGMVEGAAEPRALPALWLRVLVVSATLLVLLTGILALRLWMHAHGVGLGGPLGL